MDPTCCTPEQLELIGITPEGIALAMTFGFGFVMTCWFIGFAYSVARQAIAQL